MLIVCGLPGYVRGTYFLVSVPLGAPRSTHPRSSRRTVGHARARALRLAGAAADAEPQTAGGAARAGGSDPYEVCVLLLEKCVGFVWSCVETPDLL